MHKLMVFLLLVWLASPVFASTEPTNPVALTSTGTQKNVNYEGQSNFTSVGAWGTDSTGNPGYLVLKGCDASNACFPYYIWVASDGNVYVASWQTISAYSSFPSGSWNRTSMSVGTKIGSQ